MELDTKQLGEMIEGMRNVHSWLLSAFRLKSEALKGIPLDNMELENLNKKPIECSSSVLAPQFSCGQRILVCRLSPRPNPTRTDVLTRIHGKTEASLQEKDDSGYTAILMSNKECQKYYLPENDEIQPKLIHHCTSSSTGKQLSPPPHQFPFSFSSFREEYALCTLRRMRSNMEEGLSRFQTPFRDFMFIYSLRVG